MPYEPPVDENELNATNKKIIELKKKIQLSGRMLKIHLLNHSYQFCEHSTN